MKYNPIIFLDIDGVLVTGNYYIECRDKKENLKIEIDETSVYRFSPKTIKNLKQILEKTDAMIVISSSWRIGYPLSFFKNLFSEYGLSDRILDLIPFVNDNRGYEINTWLKRESSKFASINPDHFIIIDDHDDMEQFEDRLVKTDFLEGLNDKKRKEAINKLRSFLSCQT